MPNTELTLNCDYAYCPSTPIDVPPPPSPTLSEAFKDAHFPKIEQNVF